MKSKSTFFNFKYSCAVMCVFVILTSCSKDEISNPVTPVIKPDIEFYAVNTSNQLLRYNANLSTAPLSTVSISGLQTSESILGMDFRPSTGELYAIGNTNRLYVINLTSGAARMIGTAPVATGIVGTSAGFNFNPTVDRIRLVYSTGENFRINPENAAIAATDGSINGAAGASVIASAYSGNKAGSSSTVLYNIDLTSQKLFRQSPPNNGTLVEIGSLGITGITGKGGFDISPDGNIALAVLSSSSQNNLYQIDTTSGKATLLGNFGGSGTTITALAIPTKPVAYAIDGLNNLLIFDPTSPATIVSKAISGLSASENILGLDFRPLNGQLYALGSTSRLYTINASSGAATVVGSAPFTTLLTGMRYGFDFNPTVDRIRAVGNDGQNLRLHPDLGTVAAIDGNLNPGSPAIAEVAYTNSFAGATTTTLFDIDHVANKLYRQDPPNAGTLVEIGALGVDIDDAVGFDIGSRSGTAYAILKAGTAQGIYTINLTTGAATKVSDFSTPVRAMTLGLGF